MPENPDQPRPVEVGCVTREAPMPGQVIADRMDDGAVIGWRVGQINGGLYYIGQLTSDELAAAGVPAHLHEDPIIWAASFEGGRITVFGIGTSDESAELFAKELAVGIRAQIAGAMQ